MKKSDKDKPSYVAQAGDACRPAPMPAEQLAQLFERQLASGLWQGEDATDAGRLLATARALEDCADNRIDSAHPSYGAQVTKAIEAMCTLALDLTDRASVPSADIGIALVAAFKVASGQTLQPEVRSALTKANLTRHQLKQPSLN